VINSYEIQSQIVHVVVKSACIRLGIGIDRIGALRTTSQSRRRRRRGESNERKFVYRCFTKSKTRNRNCFRTTVRGRMTNDRTIHSTDYLFIYRPDSSARPSLTEVPVCSGIRNSNFDRTWALHVRCSSHVALSSVQVCILYINMYIIIHYILYTTSVLTSSEWVVRILGMISSLLARVQRRIYARTDSSRLDW
jgi:hypothetical protein